MKLTENEKTFLKEVIRESNFNCDSLDLEKSFAEQRLEDHQYYWSIMDCKWFRRVLPELSNAGIRAVFGSLLKKDLLSDCEDEDGDERPMTWILINERVFKNIVAIKDELV